MTLFLLKHYNSLNKQCTTLPGHFIGACYKNSFHCLCKYSWVFFKLMVYLKINNNKMYLDKPFKIGLLFRIIQPKTVKTLQRAAVMWRCWLLESHTKWLCISCGRTVVYKMLTFPKLNKGRSCSIVLQEDPSLLSHLLEALDSGAPPHGGIALGKLRPWHLLPTKLHQLEKK